MVHDLLGQVAIITTLHQRQKCSTFLYAWSSFRAYKTFRELFKRFGRLDSFNHFLSFKACLEEHPAVIRLDRADIIRRAFDVDEAVFESIWNQMMLSGEAANRLREIYGEGILWLVGDLSSITEYEVRVLFKEPMRQFARFRYGIFDTIRWLSDQKLSMISMYIDPIEYSSQMTLLVIRPLQAMEPDTTNEFFYFLNDIDPIRDVRNTIKEGSINHADSEREDTVVVGNTQSDNNDLIVDARITVTDGPINHADSEEVDSAVVGDTQTGGSDIIMNERNMVTESPVNHADSKQEDNVVVGDPQSENVLDLMRNAQNSIPQTLALLRHIFDEILELARKTVAREAARIAQQNDPEFTHLEELLTKLFLRSTIEDDLPMQTGSTHNSHEQRAATDIRTKLEDVSENEAERESITSGPLSASFRPSETREATFDPGRYIRVGDREVESC